MREKTCWTVGIRHRMDVYDPQGILLGYATRLVAQSFVCRSDGETPVERVIDVKDATVVPGEPRPYCTVSIPAKTFFQTVTDKLPSGDPDMSLDDL